MWPTLAEMNPACHPIRKPTDFPHTWDVHRFRKPSTYCLRIQKATHMWRAVCAQGSPQLSPLSDQEDLHKQEVKTKTELHPVSWVWRHATHTGAHTLTHTHTALAKTRRFAGSRHLRKSLLNQITTKLTEQRLLWPHNKEYRFYRVSRSYDNKSWSGGGIWFPKLPPYIVKIFQFSTQIMGYARKKESMAHEGKGSQLKWYLRKPRHWSYYTSTLTQLFKMCLKN